MIADNIDNFKRTLGGSGTSHRVNSILVIKGKPTETDDVADEAQERPAKESADDPCQQIFWRDRFLITMEGSAWDQEN